MTHLKFKNGIDLPVGRAFTDVLDGLLGGSIMNDTVNRTPSVNIFETKENFKIEFAAPGMSKEDFKINLEKDLLTVSSEKKEEKSEETLRYNRKEFSYSAFKRSFNLPETADKDGIQAEYKDGILTLSINKKVNVNDEVKEIKIS